MRITVAAIGKLKERFWREACAEYGKRLSRYARVEVVELDDVDPAKSGGEERARALEAEALRRAIPARQGAERFLVCLDLRGKQLTSEELSEFIEERALEGCKELVFAIGGPTGFDPSLLAEADLRLSFGKITLPHNLARVVLLEQIYRAYRIARGEPYHK